MLTNHKKRLAKELIDLAQRVAEALTAETKADEDAIIATELQTELRNELRPNWREQAATPKQIAYLRQLGEQYLPANLTKGQAYDRIQMLAS